MSARQTALITGASAGIGTEFAKLFARDRHDLVLVARDRRRLTELAESLRREHGITVSVIAKDLSVPGAAQEIAAELQTAGIAIDILVNNAGVGGHGPFVQQDAAAQVAMIQLNVVTLAHLCRLLLPGMMQRGHGGILNVASTAAFQPGPLMAVYYATKAFVLSLSEALANELAGTGVRVCALCPGSTNTEFQQRASIGRLLPFGAGMMSAARVAEAGYNGLRAGKRVVIPGAMNNLLALAVRLVPGSVSAQVVRTLQERRNRR